MSQPKSTKTPKPLGSEETATAMRFAYADPPYLGCGASHYGEQRVDGWRAQPTPPRLLGRCRMSRTWEIRLPDETADRLLRRKVETDAGCWEWDGSRRNGYGRVVINSRSYTTHRLAAALWLGLDYEDRAQIACHRCDNPPCFNPDHLFVGTASDNMRDMLAKGRRGAATKQRPTKYPRQRACVVCRVVYEPHVDHRGRSRVCSRPCHLELMKINRRARGGLVLTPDDVRSIRSELRAGAKGRDLAAAFGVNPSTISDIRHGKAWGWVE